MISLSCVCLAYGDGGVEGGWDRYDVSIDTSVGGTASNVPDGYIPNHLSGKSITILLDRDLTESENQKFSNIYDNYGINVKTKKAAKENFDKSLAALIAAGNSPDISVLRTPYFAQTASWFQPLIYFEYSDVVGVNRYNWDEAVSEAFKINGNYLAVSGYEPSDDFITLFYNKKIFNDINITTPSNYYYNGNWNFDKFAECIKNIEATGDYIGFANDGKLLNYMLGASNLDFVSYNGSKFSNNISNIFDVCQAYVNLPNASKLFNNSALDNFKSGKAGMIALPYKAGNGDEYGLKGNGFNVGSVPFPSKTGNISSQPCDVYGFGIISFSKKVETAAYVLRNMFFHNSYNSGTSSNTSSADSGRVDLYDNEGLNPKVSYFAGVLKSSNNLDYNTFIEELGKTAPEEINEFLALYQNPLNASLNKANELLSKVKAKRNITVFTNDSDYGKVSDSLKEVSDDTEVTVNATPYNGCAFLGWYENDTLVSTDENYTFTVSKDRNLEARFNAAVSKKEKIVYNFENDEARVLSEEISSIDDKIGRNGGKALHIHSGHLFDGEYHSKINLSYANVLSFNDNVKYDVFAWVKYNTNNGTGLNSGIYCDDYNDDTLYLSERLSFSQNSAIISDELGWQKIYLGTINTSECSYKEINVTFYKNEYSYDDIYIDDIEFIARTNDNVYDMNCDEKVDVKDIIRLKKFIANPNSTVVVKQKCDIDCNRVIAAGDMICLKKKLLNIG